MTQVLQFLFLIQQRRKYLQKLRQHWIAVQLVICRHLFVSHRALYPQQSHQRVDAEHMGAVEDGGAQSGAYAQRHRQRVAHESDAPVRDVYAGVLPQLARRVDGCDEIVVGDEASAAVGYEVYVAFFIICAMSFLISLAGLFGGRFFNKLLHGKISICNLIGGIILVLLGVFILLEGLNIIAL